ncbi:MAG: hypothetical protein HYZ73_08440 [Elusimicrobia bacterium]|nr:hypothetical protein [Elusimicrobiota bacterium]
MNRLVQEARYANELVELMAAWIVEKAGHPVSLDEPDVVAHVGNVRVGLACKKLDSKRKLIQRIREGRDQIQNSGMEGIIVVDVSKIVEYQTGAVARTEDDAYHALSVSTGRLWEDVERGVLAKLQGTSVGSVLFCDFQFYGIQRSIDHGAKIAHYTPFQAGYLSLRSRRNRHAAIETLEDAIMKLGLNPLSV